MAVTLTFSDYELDKGENFFKSNVDVAFSGTYTTGGFTIEAGKFGLAYFRDVQPLGLYGLTWQVTFNADKSIATFILYSAFNTELAAATSLAPITSTTFVATGK